MWFASILFRRVPDDSVEDACLAEKHSDEEGGSGRVGGGRQDEGDPRGDCEHRGGEEVDPQIFGVTVL